MGMGVAVGVRIVDGWAMEFGESAGAAALVPDVASTRGFRPFGREWLEGSLWGRFEAMVAEHGECVAVVDGGRRMSYGELHAAAKLVARGLLGGGTRLDVPIGLFLEQGLDFIVGVFGVLAAGGCYAPLDLRNPEARNAAIRESLGMEIVISQGALLARGDLTGVARVLVLDEILNRKVDDGFELPEVLGGDRLAQVLHTSGTTGTPKGVMQTHRTLLHNAMVHINSFRMGVGDRASLVYPIGVYGGNRDLFNALLSGASIHRYALDVLGLGPLAGWLVVDRITVLCCVATVFRQFARVLDGVEFGDLRLIKVGGEAVYRADLELFQRHFGDGCLLSCGLGATEIGAALQVFSGKRCALPEVKGPCGFPVEDVEVELVDDEGRVVDDGEVGEIAVTSGYLSPGYWGRDDLTKRSFRERGDGRKTYLTGDLGRKQGDGQMVHLGRKDQQVKIHGNRVELPEIEARLTGCDFLKESVVTTVVEGDGQARLVLCAVAEAGMDERGLLGKVRGHLSSRLPGYMVPTRVILLDKLPQLPNGKPDRVALRELAAEAGECVGVLNDGVRDGIESELCRMWCEVTRRSGVGVDDDLMLCGGDSLALMQFLVRVERDFGRRLDLPGLMRMPTISMVARHLSDGAEGGLAESLLVSEDGNWPRLSVVPIRVKGSKPPLYLVAPAGGCVLPYFALAHELGEDQPVYGLEVYLPFKERQSGLDIRKIGEAFAEAIQRMQPSGGLVLGGWSFGGFVALDMVSRLERAGREVLKLVVLDSDYHLPGREKNLKTFFKSLSMLGQLLAESRGHLGDGLSARISKWFSKSGRKAAGEVEAIAKRSSSLVAPITSLDVVLMLGRFMIAIENHRMPGVATDLVVLHPVSTTVDSAMAWKGVTKGRVDCRLIPGNHITLLDRENLPEVAKVIREAVL
jgi:acyl-coenzyme A synthetase/AMP-(fatty) acid ligase/thioesterase domain-containing protein/aryl carrier-like protein